MRSGSIPPLFFSPVWLVLALASCTDPDPLPSGSAGSGGAGGDGVVGGGGAGASSVGGTGGGGGPVGPCAVLTPDDTALELYSAALYSVSARVDQPLTGYAKTRLFLELYPSEATPILVPGTFDLAIAPDDDYATCEHCVLLVAFDDAGQPRRVFFQQSGTMELSLFDLDQPFTAAGTATDVRLVELSQNEDGSWNVAPGGLCFDVPSWTFDTSVVHGGPCESVEDCPNEVAQICDVETGTCQPPECSLFGDPPYCDSGFTCFSQFGPLIDQEEAGPSTGACYAGCTPTAPGATADCEGGSTCFPLDATQTFGICLAPGGPATGQPCSPSDIATGCAEGGLCAGEPPTCQAICHYLSVTSGCPAGTYCSLLNLCEPLAAGDDAPVGALCDAGSALLESCGPEGDAFRGLCFSAFNEEAVCRRTCKTADPDCPGGQSCVGVFSNADVGICLDPGVCGDGALDLFSQEICDDGNSQSGDGCSGDCATAELGPLCGMAAALPVGFPVAGMNDGVNGWLSMCDPFLAMPVSTYAFQPPAPGELRLELTSLSELGLSVVADCQDPSSELACRSSTGDEVLYVNFPAVPPDPALVVVRGENPLESGLFILQSSFTVAVCGDLSVGGPEACDDGNTVGGDGCTADCGAIEWPELCASLPVLQDGAVIDATLDGAPAFFDTTAICSYQSGRDVAYAFVAPSDGTLTVTVSSTDDLTVLIRDQCGAPDESTFLGCGNFAQAGETESASAFLQAGQVVTVIVDGYTKDDAGAFTLTADFAP